MGLLVREREGLASAPEGPPLSVKSKLCEAPDGSVTFLITMLPRCWVLLKVQVTVWPGSTVMLLTVALALVAARAGHVPTGLVSLRRDVVARLGSGLRCPCSPRP